MARVEVHEDRVVIKLTSAEQVTALRRRDVTIDRTAISSIIVTEDPWVWVRGVRAPGTSVPGRFATGTWRNFSGRDFLLIRADRSAVVIDIDVHEAETQKGWIGEFDQFSRVIVSTTHAAELIRALRLDGDAPVTEEVITVDS